MAIPYDFALQFLGLLHAQQGRRVMVNSSGIPASSRPTISGETAHLLCALPYDLSDGNLVITKDVRATSCERFQIAIDVISSGNIAVLRNTKEGGKSVAEAIEQTVAWIFIPTLRLSSSRCFCSFHFGSSNEIRMCSSISSSRTCPERGTTP